MASEDTLPVLKILIIGPSGAGKSALLLRYVDDQFDPETASATIGIDFKSKTLAVRGKPYRLNVFDTAGQERFRTLSTSYYRGAHGVILVYDVSSRKSFLSMEKWVDEARANANPQAILYLVGSKLDKVVSPVGRAVSFEEGEAFAEAQGAAGFCEVSSKTRENVRKPFIDVIDRIIKTPGLVRASTSAAGGAAANALNIGNGVVDSSGCSC